MESVKPPDAVNWTGNMDYERRTFKQHFMLYLQEGKSDTWRIALILTVVGQQVVEDKDKFDEVVKKFDEHYSLAKNETFEQYVFCSRVQQHAESFDAFLKDLKLKAGTCNFRIVHDFMIRDPYGIQN